MDKAATASLITPCYEATTACRSCGRSVFSDVLDLGMQALPDFNRVTPDWEYAPLELVQCAHCGLVQLRHTVARDRVFRTYFYRSGGSETMRASLAALADAARGAVVMDLRPVIVDIGANDGTLLDNFTSDWFKVAFEPALTLPAPYVHDGVLVRDYFSAAAYRRALAQRQALLVISAAMFYSVPDPDDFVAGIKDILAPGGVWFIEMSDLEALVDNTGFDIVGHEHVTIWSLTALEGLLHRHGLDAWRVERVPTNGGSIRVYVSHRFSCAVEESVGIQKQREAGLDLGVFKRRVEDLCEALRLELAHAQRDGKRVFLYAASTRGCTVIQTAKLGGLIAGAAERDERKLGKLVPGTQIPIVSEGAMRAAKPSLLLTMSPYYMPQFMEREHEFLSRGGEFLVVFPTPHRVGAG